MLRSCSSASAQAAKTATATPSPSSSSPVVVAHRLRSPIACRASTSSKASSAAADDVGNEKAALRNRRAMLAQGASLAAALAVARPLAAFADDEVVAVVASAPAAAPAPPAPAVADSALDVEVSKESNRLA